MKLKRQYLTWFLVTATVKRSKTQTYTFVQKFEMQIIKKYIRAFTTLQRQVPCKAFFLGLGPIILEKFVIIFLNCLKKVSFVIDIVDFIYYELRLQFL